MGGGRGDEKDGSFYVGGGRPKARATARANRSVRGYNHLQVLVVVVSSQATTRNRVARRSRGMAGVSEKIFF